MALVIGVKKENDYRNSDFFFIAVGLQAKGVGHHRKGCRIDPNCEFLGHWRV